MKSFNEFLSQRQLAENIVYLGIDPESFCESILKYVKKNKLNESNFDNERLDEFIQSLARGARGLAGAAARPFMDLGSATARGAQAVGSGALRGAQAVGSAAARGAQAVGSGVQAVGSGALRGAQAVGSGALRGAQAVGSGIAGGAQATGQYFQKGYEASRAREAQAQAADSLKRLQNSMASMGIDQESINQIIAQVNNSIAQRTQNQDRLSA